MKNHNALLAILSLCNSLNLIEVNAAARPGVVVFGPTTKPDFVRQEGQALEKCPDDFPYPFGDLKKCCRSAMMMNDTNLATDCDGGKIRPFSSLECCWQQMYVDCFDQDRGCNTALNTCQPNPVMYFSDITYGYDEVNYGPDNARTFEQCETLGTYHLAADQKKNHILIYDFGCEAAVAEFVLRNTKNRGFNDRGTKDFSIEISYDLSEWTTVINETMPSAAGPDCEIPILTYSAPTHGRYFKFTAINHYGHSSGLNYMDWHFMT